MPRVAEHVFVDHLTTFFRRSGHRVRHEVPNMGQSADLVATRGRWVFFVEAKVKDWRKALEQVMAHRHVADYICVAILQSTPSAVLREHAEREGYGLIGCSPAGMKCRWILKPRQNREVWGPQRRHLASALRRIQHVR